MSFDGPPLTDRCRGKWRGILLALGVEARFLDPRKNGPCLWCGGKDRYRWTDLKGGGSWFCSQCGHGSGIDFVMRLRGVDFRGAADLIDEVIGSARAEPQRHADPVQQRLSMRTAWTAARPVTEGDPVWRYLSGRGIAMPSRCPCLRCHPGLRHPDGTYPAMLAQVIGPDGSAVNLHRTWVAADGSGKAPVDPPRKIMAGTLPPGCAVRLAPPGERLGIAEGVETALAAGQRFGLPCWSCSSEGMLQKFPIALNGLPLVRELWVFGDADKSLVGQAAAWVAGRDSLRWAQRAKRELDVRVMIPNELGTDWADSGAVT